MDHNMQQWLKEVFQKEDVPSFDETPEFVEVLKTIMNRNKAAEKDAKAIIKAEKGMKDFYNEKAEELQMVTEFIQLKSETSRKVESLASLAEKMKLKEPTLTNYLLGITEIEDRELVKAEKDFVTSHHMSVFSRKVTQTMRMNEKLKKNLKPLAEVVEIQKSHYSEIMDLKKYFAGKKLDLEKFIKHNKECLEKAGYSEKDEIRHSDLIEKAQILKDLEDRLKTLENKLKVYHCLEPNLTETVEIVNDKAKELIQLDEEVQKLLSAYENL